jgi:hypothetical protein
MEYQVPQFIEVEDKIFGPFTLKQFIYLAGGAGLCAIFLLNLPFFLGVLLAIPVAGLALALAFYKMNGKPFVEILEYGVKYYLGHFMGKRLYLWKKVKEPVTPATTPTLAPPIPKEGLSRRKLEELAWALDVRTDKDQTIT